MQFNCLVSIFKCLPSPEPNAAPMAHSKVSSGEKRNIPRAMAPAVVGSLIPQTWWKQHNGYWLNAKSNHFTGRYLTERDEHSPPSHAPIYLVHGGAGVSTNYGRLLKLHLCVGFESQEHTCDDHVERDGHVRDVLAAQEHVQGLADVNAANKKYEMQTQL